MNFCSSNSLYKQDDVKPEERHLIFPEGDHGQPEKKGKTDDGPESTDGETSTLRRPKVKLLPSKTGACQNNMKGRAFTIVDRRVKTEALLFKW